MALLLLFIVFLGVFLHLLLDSHYAYGWYLSSIVFSIVEPIILNIFRFFGFTVPD